MDLTKLTPTHAIKLASLAVHAEEYFEMHMRNPPAALFDKGAIEGLLRDPQVREVLDDPANKVFLPEKRRAPIEIDT